MRTEGRRERTGRDEMGRGEDGERQEGRGTEEVLCTPEASIILRVTNT